MLNAFADFLMIILLSIIESKSNIRYYFGIRQILFEKHFEDPSRAMIHWHILA